MARIIDAHVLAIMYIIKALRIMMLWIGVWVADKVYQTRYVSSVYIERSPPPTMVGMVGTALAIESLSIIVVMLVMALLKQQFKQASNSFVIDSGLITLVAGDYILTSALFLAVGAAVAGTAGSRRLFRYGEDGLRGIRAVSLALLGVAVTLIFLLPAFMLMI